MEKYDPYKEHPYAEHWTGSVKDLVQKVAYSDARYGNKSKQELKNEHYN
jgi:hypothetical protein